MSGELQVTVGKNVRRIREDRGLTQEGLADLIGVHRTYVGSLEAGSRNLTLRTVEHLAGRLEVAALDLLVEQP